jgi:putative ABC transport system permease protein
MTVRFELPRSRYDDDARARLLTELESRLAELPGVQQVGLSNALPLAPGFKTGPGLVPPYADPEDPDEWDAFFRWRIADAGYFEALGLPLLRGRTFEPGDNEDAPGVVLINRPLAEHLFPDEDPVGKRLRALWDYRGEDLTVIGVVDEARHWEREAGSQHEVYVPWQQRPEHADAMVAVVHGASPPSALAPQVRAALFDLDPDLLAEVSSLDEQFYDSLGERAFNLQVLGGFALTALLLAAVGIYGVVSYAVSRRTREIGIRLAVGARPRDVRQMLQRYSLAAVLAGALGGGLGALALADVMEGLLYGVAPHDPVALLAAPLLLLAVAAFASYVPSRRGTRVDPAITLRAE